MTFVQFRKCLIKLFTGKGTIPEGNLGATSERPGITAESQTGEMSAIAARIPMDGTGANMSDEQPSECSPLASFPSQKTKCAPYRQSGKSILRKQTLLALLLTPANSQADALRLLTTTTFIPND